jgi:hypothetical protein
MLLLFMMVLLLLLNAACAQLDLILPSRRDCEMILGQCYIHHGRVMDSGRTTAAAAVAAAAAAAQRNNVPQLTGVVAADLSDFTSLLAYIRRRSYSRHVYLLQRVRD